MSLTIKAYLKKDEDNWEIRRFGIPPDVSDFKQLKQKVSDVFPSLQHGQFSVHWKDSEEDEIVLSSDDELAEAIRNVSDGVLKIYITVTPQPAASGPIHRGVSCHGCNGPIYGARYKCCVCPDVDLCRQCENQGVHQEHDMWKITTPTDQWTPKCGEHFIPPEVQECIRQHKNEHVVGDNTDGCCCIASSGPQGAWSSATASSSSSSSGTSPAVSGNRLTWVDVGRAWAQYGQNWNDAAKRFSRNMAHTMNPFDDMDGMDLENGGVGDLQCDGDHEYELNGKPYHVQNDVNKAKEMELEEAMMFGDGASKSTSQRRPTDGTDNDTNSSTQVRIGFPGPIHPDPKISKALIQMLSMGFKDEEGKLTKMLEEKNGEIDSVIESINQTQKVE